MNRKRKQLNRIRRHSRVRSRIIGTAKRPRISVFKSNKNIFVQLIDDEKGKTLLSNSMKGKKGAKKSSKSDHAKVAGEALAKKAKEGGITNVVFDRGGYKYHGRVKALADGLRAGGLKF